MMLWTCPEDIDHWFYEIDLNKEEKLEILSDFTDINLVSRIEGFMAWSSVYNVRGTVYRVYGELGNFGFDVDSHIARLEPHERHSGR